MAIPPYCRHSLLGLQTFWKFEQLTAVLHSYYKVCRLAFQERPKGTSLYPMQKIQQIAQERYSKIIPQ